jgi:hypothetical protein
VRRGWTDAALNGKPSEAVTIVRNWLRTHSDFGMPSAEQMLRRFARFCRQLPAMCRRLHFNTSVLIFVDYAALVSAWLAENPIENDKR